MVIYWPVNEFNGSRSTHLVRRAPVCPSRPPEAVIVVAQLVATRTSNTERVSALRGNRSPLVG